MTEDEKQRVREEEYFRDQVRKEIASSEKKPWFKRLLEADNLKWVMTTLLIPVTVFAYGGIDEWIHHGDKEKAQLRDEARLDVDHLAKLLPELHGTDAQQKGNAVMVLSFMAENATASEGAKNLFQQIKKNADTQTDSSSPHQRSEGAITRESIENAAGSRTPTDDAAVEVAAKNVTAPSEIDESNILKDRPQRVYVQIYFATQQAAAIKLRDSLRSYGIPVPGIDNVGNDHGPGKIEHAQRGSIDVRFYYSEDRAAADNISTLVKTVAGSSATVTMRDLSGWSKDKKGKTGTVEVWYPCSATDKDCVI